MTQEQIEKLRQAEEDFVCKLPDKNLSPERRAQKRQILMKECEELRSKANLWTDEERERLGKEMMSLFYGEMKPPFDNSVVEKIEKYLEFGGLFNPELVNYEEVRDLLIAARDQLIRYK